MESREGEPINLAVAFSHESPVATCVRPFIKVKNITLLILCNNYFSLPFIFYLLCRSEFETARHVVNTATILRIVFAGYVFARDHLLSWGCDIDRTIWLGEKHSQVCLNNVVCNHGNILSEGAIEVGHAPAQCCRSVFKDIKYFLRVDVAYTKASATG